MHHPYVLSTAVNIICQRNPAMCFTLRWSLQVSGRVWLLDFIRKKNRKCSIRWNEKNEMKSKTYTYSWISSCIYCSWANRKRERELQRSGVWCILFVIYLLALTKTTRYSSLARFISPATRARSFLIFQIYATFRNEQQQQQQRLECNSKVYDRWERLCFRVCCCF